MPRGVPNQKPEVEAAGAEIDLETLPRDITQRTYSWVTFASPQKGEDKFVVGAHNGVAWSYKRGIKLPVPDMIIKGCLEVAITTYLDQDANEMRESPSYGYTVHGPCSIEEVLKFRNENGTV